MSTRARRTLIVGLVAVLCLIVGLCVILGNLAKPLASRGVAGASEWSSRVASDYPGWKQVGFNVNSFSRSDGSRTTYAFGLVPPGRKFAVGVRYVSENGAPPVLEDETLRPAGKFHGRSGSLLDYIESNYVKQGRSITAVTSGEDGVVTINWMKVTKVAFFSSSVSDFNRLTYDESSRSWHGSRRPKD